MVIWLFAGGGQSEIGTSQGRVGGLVNFFRKWYGNCRFVRKTPVRRPPAPKANRARSAHGRTGSSLVKEVRERLVLSLRYDEPCDIILVLDDLDCRDAAPSRQRLLKAVEAALGERQIERFVGFAAPELEAWLIADWDHSFGEHPDFRGQRQQGMRHWLSTVGNVPFDNPETFGNYDAERDACSEKLSDTIIESTVQGTHNTGRSPYSKSMHTPAMLLSINPELVAQRCRPMFQELHEFLVSRCTFNRG
ncbi:MAG: DUF4276 family protein [Thermodesulfobacteriota bacterium]